DPERRPETCQGDADAADPGADIQEFSSRCRESLVKAVQRWDDVAAQGLHDRARADALRVEDIRVGIVPAHLERARVSPLEDIASLQEVATDEQSLPAARRAGMEGEHTIDGCVGIAVGHLDDTERDA